MTFAIFLFEALVCKTHFEGKMVSSMNSFSSMFLCVFMIAMVSSGKIQYLLKVRTYYIFLLFDFLCLLSSYPPLGNTLPSLSSLSEIIRSKRLRDLLWLKTELLDIWNCASLIFWRFLKPNGTLIYKMCKEHSGSLI